MHDASKLNIKLEEEKKCQSKSQNREPAATGNKTTKSENQTSMASETVAVTKKSKNKENSSTVAPRKETYKQEEVKTTPAIISGYNGAPSYDNFERRIHSLRRSTYAEDRERERDRERKRERDLIRKDALVSSSYHRYEEPVSSIGAPYKPSVLTYNYGESHRYSHY